MTSVAFVSPAYGRFAVTALVLAQRRRLIRELAGRGIDAVSIIVADDGNLDIAQEYGCETVTAANRPLGQKCNIGLRAAARQAEYVVWVGSDDWIHPDVFTPLLEPRKRFARVIAGTRMVLVDLRVGRLRRVASPSKYGAIPWLLDSRLLQQDREWVRPDLNHGLDGALIRGLRRQARPRFEFQIHDPNDFRCVDFKTQDNITPYRGLAKHLGIAPEQSAWTALAAWYPTDLVDLARATAAGHKQGGLRPVRLIHPETGEVARVSRAGAEVLRKRGWKKAGDSPARVTPVVQAKWPDTHDALDAHAVFLGFTYPDPKSGKKKLTVAEKIAALEAAGHTPDDA